MIGSTPAILADCRVQSISLLVLALLRRQTRCAACCGCPGPAIGGGEIKRRGRLPPGVETDLRSLGHRLNVRPHLPMKRTSAKNQIRRRPVDIAEVSLTRGQVNAVRAAFKAGITPTRIARQFGISQSNVRKVLASDEPKR